MNLKIMCHPRKGAMMMMMLVMLIVGSIVAMRMIPNEELIERRVDEMELHTAISHLREALDLKMMAEPSWDLLQTHPNVATDPVHVHNLIASLSVEGYLRSTNIADPTVMNHRWAPGQVFWKVSTNLASYTNFVSPHSIGEDDFAQWNDSNAVATTSTYFLWIPELDDYPNQNKLGVTMTGAGKSLMITK